ncbi:MAG: sulfotransferase domain-containing protein [Rubrobacter sp.]
MIRNRIKARVKALRRQVFRRVKATARRIGMTEDERRREVLASRAEALAPRVVWIFGGGRSGTTWLAAVIRDMPDQRVWFEPNVGKVFDPHQLGLKRDEGGGGIGFIFSEKFKEVWLRNARDFVLYGALARFRNLVPKDRIFIKEPAGSIGARILAAATPESAIVLLVRDPRDVVASWMDARSPGSWSLEQALKKGSRSVSQVEQEATQNRLTSVARHAERYEKIVTESTLAFDEHPGRKVFVRYEELRSDAFGTMRRLYAGVGVPVNDEALARVVEEHSWENIPEEKKGSGKFYRKAKSEGWREDLTEEEVVEVERRVGHALMERLGYETAARLSAPAVPDPLDQDGVAD